MSVVAWLGTALAVLLGTLALFFFLFLKKRSRYWIERGIPGPDPNLIFGNVKDCMTVKITEAEVVHEIVEKYKEHKIIGMFNLWKPIILVKNAELAKRITEKEAEYFIDHPAIISEETTDYAFYSIFTMMGDPWKSRRQVLTKLFTPRKLKEYLEDIRPGLRTFMGKLDGDVDTVEPLTSFTAETIVKVLYGLDLNNDPHRITELVHVVENFIRPPLSTVIKVISYSIVPGLFKLLKMGVMPAKVWDYASSLYTNLVNARSDLSSDRDDAFRLIRNLQLEGSSNFGKIEEKEAVGHTFQFLLGGVHTSATVMSHVLVMLSKHPEVQDKLKKEVKDILNGATTVTYDHISQMKYLDGILLETMRLIPLLGILKRTCTKECELTSGLKIPVGMDIWIDVTGIHRDPNLFPDPEKFKPERWANGEADPAAFMTFGKGPRICIGKRLAEMQAKLLLSTVISKFDLLPSSKNQVPLKYDPKTIIITSAPQGGNWVNFQPRS